MDPAALSAIARGNKEAVDLPSQEEPLYLRLCVRSDVAPRYPIPLCKRLAFPPRQRHPQNPAGCRHGLLKFPHLLAEDPGWDMHQGGVAPDPIVIPPRQTHGLETGVANRCSGQAPLSLFDKLKRPVDSRHAKSPPAHPGQVHPNPATVVEDARPPRQPGGELPQESGGAKIPPLRDGRLGAQTVGRQRPVGVGKGAGPIHPLGERRATPSSQPEGA